MGRRQLYIGDFLGATITVVDVDAAAVDRTIEMGTVDVDGIAIGIQPDSFAVSPDRGTLYASRFPHGGGLDQIPGANPPPGDLVAIDTETDEILWTLPFDGKPNHISISKDGRHVYVPMRDKAHVEIVDVESRAVVGKINCGWGPHGTKLSRDGKLLYTGNIIDHKLAVLDLERRRPRKAISLGAAVRPFVITSDDKVAYVQLSGLHGFVVVDLAEGRRTQTVHLPELPLGTVTETAWPYTIGHGMALRKAENELWVAATAGGYVAVYEVPSLKLAQVIEVGEQPAYVLFDDGERLCFASNRKEDTVSIIDIAGRTEVARIPVGNHPSRMKYVEVG